MITIRKGAVLDAKQKKVIAAIEPFTAGQNLEVTRGHSTPQEQLATIEKYAKEQKLTAPVEFIPSGPFDVKVNVLGRGLLFHWQRVWEELLLQGVIVNPPLDTTCGVEYIRESGENMKGKKIKASPHISGEKGTTKKIDGKWQPTQTFPIDFSQKVNGTPNITHVYNIMRCAKKAGASISYIKMEPKNGCVHAGTT